MNATATIERGAAHAAERLTALAAGLSTRQRAQLVQRLHTGADPVESFAALTGYLRHLTIGARSPAQRAEAETALTALYAISDWIEMARFFTAARTQYPAHTPRPRRPHTPAPTPGAPAATVSATATGPGPGRVGGEEAAAPADWRCQAHGESGTGAFCCIGCLIEDHEHAAADTATAARTLRHIATAGGSETAALALAILLKAIEAHATDESCAPPCAQQLLTALEEAAAATIGRVELADAPGPEAAR